MDEPTFKTKTLVKVEVLVAVDNAVRESIINDALRGQPVTQVGADGKEIQLPQDALEVIATGGPRATLEVAVEHLLEQRLEIEDSQLAPGVSVIRIGDRYLEGEYLAALDVSDNPEEDDC